MADPRYPTAATPRGDLSYYTAEYVTVRLEQAGRTLLSLPNRGCLPAGLRSNWPSFAHAAMEAYGYGTVQVRPPVPRARAISEMDEAYGWVGLVTIIEHRHLIWLRSFVHPISGRHLWSWRKLMRRFGIHRDTLAAWHGRGVDRIVTRLNAPHYRPKD